MLGKVKSSNDAAKKQQAIKIVSSASLAEDNDNGWIDQVLKLQELNHKHLIEKARQDDQGFVTVHHAKSDLQTMAKYCPQFLAVIMNHDEDEETNPQQQQPLDSHGPNARNCPFQVVGYSLTVDSTALAASPSLENLYKIFFDMTNQIDTPIMTSTIPKDEGNNNTASSFLLKDVPWALGAQVCVAKEYRRRGILQELYNVQTQHLAAQYGMKAVVTAVDHANVPSLRAHEKANFVVSKRFETGGRDNTGWSIIVRLPSDEMTTTAKTTPTPTTKPT